MAGHILLGMGTARHQQGRAGPDHHARRYVVEAAKLRLTHAHAFGRIRCPHGAGSHPHGPAGQAATGVGFQIGLKHLGVVPGQQDLRRASGHDHRLVDGRVEGFEILHRHLGQFGSQCHVDVAAYGHGVKVGVVADVRQARVEAIRLRHDVLDGLQLGHVHARLHRHGQVGVGRVQAGALVAPNRLANAAFAPVVGGQCQVPVAKHGVELLQVVQCGAGGGQHVAPVIAEHALLEFKGTSSGRHELPHAGRLGTGHGLRVEGALHKGQQGQLGGHVAQLQLFHNVEQVLFGALRHAVDVVRAGGVPLLAVVHQVVVQIGHGVAIADAFPQILGRRERGNGARAGALIRFQIGLQIGLQRAGRCGRWSGTCCMLLVTRRGRGRLQLGWVVQRVAGRQCDRAIGCAGSGFAVRHTRTAGEPNKGAQDWPIQNSHR